MKIEINGLDVIYKNGNHAVKNITLTIEEGMFGLLGPNGAGKSSLMKVLVALMKPSTGQVLINGEDIQKKRKKLRSYLGYLPQDFRFFTRLKTWEFLDYAGSLAGIKNRKQRLILVDELLDKVGLLEARDRKANRLSGGMKRRLGIAQALIGDPKIIVVDEPTTGLDPDERIRFRNILSDLSQNDVTIILSTHIVSDISSTCQKMALLSEGKLVYSGSPDELVDKARGHVFNLRLTQEEYDNIKDDFHVISSIPSEIGWDAQVVAEEVSGFDSQVVEPNLEHAYVYYMEHKINGVGIIN